MTRAAGRRGAGSASLIKDPARYKTELCATFSRSGVCPYGHKCQFAHGVEELRMRPAASSAMLAETDATNSFKTKECRSYARTGRCPYGSRCRFMHGDIADAQQMAMLRLTGEDPHGMEARTGASAFLQRGSQTLGSGNGSSAAYPYCHLQSQPGQLLQQQPSQQQPARAGVFGAGSVLLPYAQLPHSAQQKMSLQHAHTPQQLAHQSHYAHSSVQSATQQDRQLNQYQQQLQQPQQQYQQQQYQQYQQLAANHFPLPMDMQTASPFPAPMSSPGSKSVVSESPPLTPSAGPSVHPSPAMCPSVQQSPAMMSAPLPSPALQPTSMAGQSMLPSAFLPLVLPQSAADGFPKRLEAEGRNLLELAGVREGSLDLPDLPSTKRPQANSDPRSNYRMPLADQLSVILDDSFGKPSSPSPPLGENSHHNSQMRHSIAMQLSSVLYDDDPATGMENNDNDSFHSNDLMEHFAAMGMAPSRCVNAQRKAASNGFANPTAFAANIQRPLG